jgi:hypothetical protein
MIFPLLRDFLLSRQKANDSCFIAIIASSQQPHGPLPASPGVLFQCCSFAFLVQDSSHPI